LKAADSDAVEGHSDLENLEKDSVYSKHSDSRIPEKEPMEFSQESTDSEKKSVNTKD
jgi:hypothetical protein